jgi:hypothetical protein
MTGRIIEVSFLRVQPGDIKARADTSMHNPGIRAAAALAAWPWLAGCGHINTRSFPKATSPATSTSSSSTAGGQLRRRRRDGAPAEEMGYDASAGALTMMPPDTELIVSYDDMWTWDFNNYMIEIDMQVRTARGDKILAVGHYFRPSMVFGHPPADMIHELLVKLFKHA